ncbi:hypothetical protein BH18ACT15_BH18ACT15_02810 [soil metagenome]
MGVALAVALIGSLGAFFAASKAHMTEQAAKGVPVDWQIQLPPGTGVGEAARRIGNAPGTNATAPVGYGNATRFVFTTGGSVQITGPGKVLGIPAGYAKTFPREIRSLVGSSSGVLLAQQTAANLQASVGSEVTIGRPGLAPKQVTLAGIVDLPAADSLFQAVGASPGAGLTAPPDNVALLPLGMWHRFYDPVAKVDSGAVVTQIHVALSRPLPPDPGAAFAQVAGRALNVEARLAGRGVVANNLGAQLDAARGDAIYAQLLFMFLGVPGIVLAALLTTVVTGAGRERRRKEQALLRIRGASPRNITRLAFAEAAVVAVAGCGLGMVGAWLAGRLALDAAQFGATPAQALIWTGAATLIGAGLAFGSIVIPSRNDARRLTVSKSRAPVGAARRPLWTRLYLDIVLLVGAALVFWQAVKSGYQVVLAPEGVPTISVNYFTLAAPLMLWVGAALLAWRLADVSLTRGRGVLTAATRPFAGGLASVVSASMARQRRLLTRGLVIVAVAGSFAVSTGVFNATYAAQSQVDAQLTNGADVTASTAAAGGLPPKLPRQVRHLPGVASAQTMQHRFAYVGPDLQDMYGIKPTTIERATPMSDAFFANGSASKTLRTLAHTSNGVLVSEETVKDYQLQAGDTVRLRLQFARDHKYHVVPFKYVGVVREFPTAPLDSFLVANASYVAAKSGSPAPQTLLVKTNGSPTAVSAQVRHLLGRVSGATVTDIVHQLHVTLTGLTTLDLSGLTRLELTFAVFFAVAAAGLVLGLGLVERRRNFAIASALGARGRHLSAFVWSEASFVTLGGVIAGSLAGWEVSYMLVKILTGVFDPPPTHLFVPWLYLGLVAAASCLAVIVSGRAALSVARKSVVSVLRDL